MAEYLIFFNQQWVGDHTEDWFRSRGPLAEGSVQDTVGVAHRPRAEQNPPAPGRGRLRRVLLVGVRVLAVARIPRFCTVATEACHR
jgi:hypothetical protein